MKYSLTILKVVLVLLIITGCDLTDKDSKKLLTELLPPEEELIPLEVGNYWVYEQWYRDSTITDTVREEVLRSKDIIVENTKVRTYGTHRFHYKERPREDALVWLRANGPRGLYYVGGQVPTDSLYNLSKGLYFKYPATIGDKWEHTAVIYSIDSGNMSFGDTQTITLLDTTKTVETPAGTYENCYVYSHWGFNTSDDVISLEKHYFYIKPAIGIVGVDTYVADDKNDLYGQWRILEYKLE